MTRHIDFRSTDDRMVYVKSVPVADLSDELREQSGELTELYALHNAKGEQLALVANRSLAFALARQNDMSPVAVH